MITSVIQKQERKRKKGNKIYWTVWSTIKCKKSLLLLWWRSIYTMLCTYNIVWDVTDASKLQQKRQPASQLTLLVKIATALFLSLRECCNIKRYTLCLLPLGSLAIFLFCTQVYSHQGAHVIVFFSSFSCFACRAMRKSLPCNQWW